MFKRTFCVLRLPLSTKKKKNIIINAVYVFQKIKYFEYVQKKKIDITSIFFYNKINL